MLPPGLILVVSPAGAGVTNFYNELVQMGAHQADVILTEAIRARCSENDDATGDRVTDLVCTSVTARLRSGLPAVVDATELGTVRAELITVAKRFGATVSVVRDGSTELDHTEGADLVVDAADVRGVLWGNGFAHLRDVDVIGDVHGQLDALHELLESLGYHGTLGESGFGHSDGRLPVFVGDLVDKGPEPVAVLKQVARAVKLGQALCVRGNHEHRLTKTLTTMVRSCRTTQDWREALEAESRKGSPRRRVTLRQLAQSEEDCEDGFSRIRSFLSALPLRLELDGGKLVVVHAATKHEHLGQQPQNGTEKRDQENWSLFGPTGTARDAEGHRERVDWITAWCGPTVVRGHVMVQEPTDDTSQHGSSVISIDTGAGDGCTLSALSWPSKEFTSVECRVMETA